MGKPFQLADAFNYHYLALFPWRLTRLTDLPSSSRAVAMCQVDYHNALFKAGSIWYAIVIRWKLQFCAGTPTI